VEWREELETVEERRGKLELEANKNSDRNVTARS